MAAQTRIQSDSSRLSVDYNLRFIAASLRPELVRIVAEEFLATGDWELTRNRILSSNALQCRSSNSGVRLERELRQRLRHLTNEQLVIAATATAEDRANMAWLAACKSIQIAYEFAVDVMREKLALHDPILRHSDYEAFFEHQSISHPELAQLAMVSRNKVRQVLLLMLSEAGLLTNGPALGRIQRPVLSQAVVRAITSDNPDWLAGFLVPDGVIPSRRTSRT